VRSEASGATARPGAGPEPSQSLARASFEDLHVRHRARVAALVRRLVADRGLQEELVQETFVRAWRAIDSLDPARPAWPWLATIARRLCADALRAPHRRRERPQGALAAGAAVVGASQGMHGGDPLEACLARERHEVLQQALHSVSGRHRRLLVLKDLEGWNLEEIGALEGLPPEAVKSALRRARASLRSSYGRLLGGPGAGALVPLASLLGWARRTARGAFDHLRRATLRVAAVARGDSIASLPSQALQGSVEGGAALVGLAGGGVAAAIAGSVLLGALVGLGPPAHAGSAPSGPRVGDATSLDPRSPATGLLRGVLAGGAAWVDPRSPQDGSFPVAERGSSPAGRASAGPSGSAGASLANSPSIGAPSLVVPAAPSPAVPAPLGAPSPRTATVAPPTAPGVPPAPVPPGLGGVLGAPRPSPPSAGSIPPAISVEPAGVPTRTADPPSPEASEPGLGAPEPPAAAGSPQGPDTPSGAPSGSAVDGPTTASAAASSDAVCGGVGPDRPVPACRCVLLARWTLPAPGAGLPDPTVQPSPPRPRCPTGG
jgi:RNA polymerase sigma-70 factor (ECF subfamily)